MKIINSLFLFMLFAGLSLSSCKKDENKSNYMNYDGKDYNLTQGLFSEYGQNQDGSYDHDLVLLSNGLIYNETLNELEGFGNYINIDLNTSSKNGLVSGAYLFSQDRNSFTFVDGGAGFGLNIMNETIDEEVEIIGGEITITVGSKETKIEFDLDVENGKTIKGVFEGEIKEVF